MATLARPPSRQTGFTLFELLISALIIGILSWMAASNMGSLMTAKQQVFNAEQAAINQKIAQAFISWSEGDSRVGTPDQNWVTFRGTLPLDCSDVGERYGTIENPDPNAPCNEQIHPYLIEAGLDPATINFASPRDNRIRVYQKLPALTVQSNLTGVSSAPITLYYDAGVLYTTNCRITESCYLDDMAGLGLGYDPEDPHKLRLKPEPEGGGLWIPTIEPLTLPSGGASGVTYFSTLALQKKLLKTTSDRIVAIKDALQRHFKTEQAKEASATLKYSRNFYPNDDELGGGAFPDAGCTRPWITLASDESTILKKIGLTPGYDLDFVPTSGYVEGLTAWGGTIQYCPDFNPSGFTPDQAPHTAALRVHQNLSLGENPTSTSPKENVYIFF